MLPQTLTAGETLAAVCAHVFLRFGVLAQAMAVQFALNLEAHGAHFAGERLLAMDPFVTLHFLTRLEHFIALGTWDFVGNGFLDGDRRGRFRGDSRSLALLARLLRLRNIRQRQCFSGFALLLVGVEFDTVWKGYGTFVAHGDIVADAVDSLVRHEQ